MILQGGGDDFTGAGTETIDEDGHRAFLRGSENAALPPGIVNLFLLIAPLRAHDASLGQEHAADLDRGQEQAARVGA